MRRGEYDAMLSSRGLVSAQCLICNESEPPVDEFSFDSFWVRGKEDWPDYTGGPVHRVCADLAWAKKPKPPVAASRSPRRGATLTLARFGYETVGLLTLLVVFLLSLAATLILAPFDLVRRLR